MRLFHLISLGCAKNLVDSELMLGSLIGQGWEPVEEAQDADLLIVNTCGFIQPAVEEAIDEVLELARLKEEDPAKKLVVIGCMVQRYGEGLRTEFPEVDLFVGTEACHKLEELVAPLFAEGVETAKVVLPPRFLMDSDKPRVLATPFYRAWCKITEGCDNRCSYCMIPSIRGPLRSRPMDDLVKEAVGLEQHGVKELSLIAQDLTAYGDDFGSDTNLVRLLDKIFSASNIPWLRLLYLYPSGVTDELLSFIASHERIVPYLDIPFQHVSDRILQRMNRRHGGDDLYRLVERIRRYIPDVALRTTLLVGFPGETEKDVEEVLRFLEAARLDHVGVFPYANEEGCPAERLADQVPEEVKIERLDAVMQKQAAISSEVLSRFVGRKEKVLVEGVSRETDLLLEGRTRFQAPEVDGCVLINDGTAKPGDIVTVEITESQVYDLVGGIIEED